MQTVYEIPPLIADYGDPEREIDACRTDCALFDFSFVQRAAVKGREARAVVEAFATRNLEQMLIGEIRYALRLRENETLLSDLTVWKISDEHFEVMSGHLQDIRDLSRQGGSRVRDITAQSAIFAVQGPRALEKLAPHCRNSDQLASLRYFEHVNCTIGGASCRVGRLGYTGEAGFELICPKADAKQLWTRLTESMQPSGFAAADTLRIEAGFPLFWNDFSLPVTAQEAGLNAFCRYSSDFPAKRLKRICFSAMSTVRPALWRPDSVPQRPSALGEIAVTSACYSTRAGRVLGLGYVLASSLEAEAKLYDQIGHFQDIRIQRLPFYDFAKARPRAAWR